MMMMDASYNFGYDSDDSSRVEVADPAGNVVGSYKYTNPNGEEMVVRYRAGAEVGFVVENQGRNAPNYSTKSYSNNYSPITFLAFSR